MPISYRNGSGATAATAACTPTMPSGIVVNDLILVNVTQTSTVSTISSGPVGYTLITNLTDVQNTFIYRRLATADANDNFSITWSGGTRWVTAIGVYAGVDPSSPFVVENGVIEGASSVTVHTAPSITNDNGNAWGLYFGNWRGTATPISWTPGTGLTERLDVDGTVAGSTNHVTELSDTNGGVAPGAVAYFGTGSVATAAATMWAAFLRPAPVFEQLLTPTPRYS